MTLIPITHRWIYLQSAAAKFRNAGLDADGIELALWNFLKAKCEGGTNYPPEKVKALAEHAALRPSDNIFSVCGITFKPRPEIAQNIEMKLWNYRVLAERGTTCST